MTYTKIEQNIKESINDEFRTVGVEIDPNKTIHEFFLAYMNWRSRFLKQTPRKVLYSKEIKQNADFKKFKKVIEKIEYKIKNGENLDSFLSTGVVHSPYKENGTSKDADKDNYLNAFKIHHLHLGENYTAPKKGIAFVERHNELLYIMSKPDKVYFLDISPHDFGNIEVFKVIQNNWDELLAPYEIRGALGVDQKITDSENIQQLLQAGITTFVPINGKIYAPGFLTTSGHNGDMVRNIQRIIDFFNELPKHLDITKEYEILVKDGLLFINNKTDDETIWFNGQFNSTKAKGKCALQMHIFDFNS